MLFSDGADLTVKPETISSQLLTLLANWEGPVHTFQAGSNHMFKDLAIEEIDSAGGLGFIFPTAIVGKPWTACATDNHCDF